jgi:hypothetical protein
MDGVHAFPFITLFFRFVCCLFVHKHLHD